MTNNQQPQMNIDFSQTTAEVCEKCGNDTFVSAIKLRKLSALLSPAGQETIIPVQIFACMKCNHVNKGFLPKELDNDTL